jgi:hypothetical protein
MESLKYILVTVLLTILLTPSFAEGDTKLFGVRAGYQVSDIFNDGKNTGTPINNFYVGLYKNNKIVPTLHWMFGAEYFVNGYYNTDNNKLTMNTIGVPINLKLKLGPFFALGGVSANFVVSQDYENSGTAQKAPVFDLPVFLGAGFRILIVNIEARYHWGMLEIDSYGDHNQYFQLGAGVSF